ncbi:ABC transporter substrate-binding protein [Canibacter zhoujuaniae]|uniref:ABC transporter substrate-binding protein n=1 Tax=Canibacter zhoujuaniae TaxID=2708343 RepID=UPI00141F598B|nr:ABC transporter substrate-binding protein [Canibacter zhoujuaniae]
MALQLLVKQGGALTGVTLTFSSYGGIYQDAQIASLEGFQKQSGARVLSDGPTEYSKIKAQVDSGNVTWDVVDTDVVWAERECGNLLMPLDFNIIDVSDIDPALVGKCHVPAMQYAYVIMYNKDKYPKAPTGWADFFNTEKFPGTRAIAGFEDVGPGIFEGALLADGVKTEDLYPLDMDRAYTKMDSIKDSIIFWSTGAESQQMLESGEADMALVWSGRGYKAVEAGANYAPIWDGALRVMDSISVPKGAQNPEAAMALINHYVGPEAQTILSEQSSYAPINNLANPQFDELGKSFLITDPEINKKLINTDGSWWGKVYDEELKRFIAWIQN